LLPVAYFHVVFTLPHELNELCLRNPRAMYDLLFESAWYVLKTFGLDEKWLGAQSAATNPSRPQAVHSLKCPLGISSSRSFIHTWGQNLQLHPHVHCIVPSGGLTKNNKWQNPRKGGSNFLYPVLAMNKVYKGYFLKQLKSMLEAGLLTLPKDFPSGKLYNKWKDKLYKKEWVVYTKPPFSKPENVVDYLARYSHRVALTNSRISIVTKKEVAFTYKDYRNNAKRKTMRLKGRDFLRRFCLHILPPGFRKIRHFGFLSNAVKTKSLTIAKAALESKKHIALTREERKAYAKLRVFGLPKNSCRCCKKGQLITIDIWLANKDPPPYLKVGERK